MHSNEICELKRRKFETQVANGSPLIVFISCIFFTLSIICGFAAANITDLQHIVMLMSLSMTFLLISCLFIVANGRPISSLFELRIGAWFFSYSVFAFGLSTITILDPKWVSDEVLIEWIPQTLILLAIAFLVALIGYQTRFVADFLGAPIRILLRYFSRRRVSTPRSPGILYLVFCIGIFSDLLTVILTGQYGYLGAASLVDRESTAWYTQPLYILSNAKLAAIFGLTMVALKDKKKINFFILVPAAVLALVLSLLTGMKESFFDVFISILIAWILVRGRIPILGTVCALLVFVFIVTPFITQLRSDVRGTEALNVQEASRHTVSKLFSMDSYLAETSSGDSALQIASRIRLVDNLSIIQAKTPGEISYRDINEIISAPLSGMVPRIIWPEKPVRLAGYEFYKTYYQGQGVSSSAITPQGSLYMYGGMPVVLIGMFLIGATLRGLDDSLESISNPHSAILLVFLAPIIIKQELDVPSFLANIPIMLTTWVIAVLVVFETLKSKYSYK